MVASRAAGSLSREAQCRPPPSASRSAVRPSPNPPQADTQRKPLVLAHVRTLPAPGRPRKRAVAADVAAELGQWDKDLRRVRDAGAVAKLAQPASLARERLPRLVDELEGLGRGESLTHGVSLRAAPCPRASPSTSRRARTARNRPSC